MAQHINLCPVKAICTTAPSITNEASIANPVTADVIVSDGTNWAIKYSDGWVEQGGYVTLSRITSYGKEDVTFNSTINGVDVSFSSTPVYVHCTPVHTGTTGGEFTLYGVESVSSTGFAYRKTANNTYLSGFYWIAKGMGTVTVEPEPSGDSYVEDDTLYAGDSVTDDIVTMSSGTVDDDSLIL